jgi:hypothetical protein
MEPMDGALGSPGSLSDLGGGQAREVTKNEDLSLIGRELRQSVP